MFDAAISTIMQKPAGTSRTAESHTTRENEKNRRHAPNPIADTPTHRPRPRTLRRSVSDIAPASAPIPDMDSNNP